MKKNRWIVFLPIVILAALGWWVGKNLQLDNKIGGAVVEVLAQDVDELLDDESVFVLDVHTPEQKHIPGTDAFIPFDQIEQNLGKLPEDKNTPILVYCRSGSMSSIASKELVEMGYTEVYDLIGGVGAYRETHVEVVITPEEVDLGTVIYEQGAETEFTLTNNTPNELVIERVTGSCACTQPSIEKNILAPYESIVIKVKFEPSIHKDDSDMGDLVRLIFVDTDNENFEHLVIKITAKVVKE